MSNQEQVFSEASSDEEDISSKICPKQNDEDNKSTSASEEDVSKYEGEVEKLKKVLKKKRETPSEQLSSKKPKAIKTKKPKTVTINKEQEQEEQIIEEPVVKTKVKKEKIMYDVLDKIKDYAEYFDEYSGILRNISDDIIILLTTNESLDNVTIKKYVNKLWDIVNSFIITGLLNEEKNHSDTLNKIENFKKLNSFLFSTNTKFKDISKDKPTSSTSIVRDFDNGKIKIYTYAYKEKTTLNDQILNMWSILCLFLGVVKELTDSDYKNFVKTLKPSETLMYILDSYNKHISEITGGSKFITDLSFLKNKPKQISKKKIAEKEVTQE